MAKATKGPAQPKWARRAAGSLPASSLARIPFHGEEIEAARDEDGVWIAIRRVCDVLGPSMQGQLSKLKGKPWATIKTIFTTGPDGKVYQTACIDLDALPMWLATIEPGRVRPELRQKLALYQREAARALRDHFFGSGPSRGPLGAEPEIPPSLALDRLEVADRVLELAGHDLAMLARLATEPERSTTAAAVVEALQHGLAWVYDTLKSTSAATENARDRDRWFAVDARWQACWQTFAPLWRRHGRRAR